MHPAKSSADTVTRFIPGGLLWFAVACAVHLIVRVLFFSSDDRFQVTVFVTLSLIPSGELLMYVKPCWNTSVTVML
ncbi:hypothetical protein BEH94_01205 [Candidatus Altiarchaeales archaeon WOR_SM1_SCG]|nr:hypothetical protein BEH94_01205 [Candidatus Altiarchaeales archaeon WOR_SM1_SCG]